MTTPQQPATEAISAAIDWAVNEGDQETADEAGEQLDALLAALTAEHELAMSLAIEGQERNGQLLALRDALDQLIEATFGDAALRTSARAKAERLLKDTAPAAAEIEARMEKRGYGRGWAEAQGWFERIAELERIDREQPATEGPGE